MTTERVKSFLAPLKDESISGFSTVEITTFCNLGNDELTYLAKYREDNARTILHRLVHSGKGFYEENPLSPSVQQQFFANLSKMFMKMDQLQPQDADRITPRLLNNKNYQFVQQIVTLAKTANIEWVFNHLPALATYVDVPEREAREMQLRERGLLVPSIEQIYLNSRRVSKLQQGLESARIVRDHALAELNAERKKVQAMQQQAETYKRERDSARRDIQQLHQQIDLLSREKMKTGSELEALKMQLTHLQFQYSAGQKQIAELDSQLKAVRSKLSDAEIQLQTLKTTIKERASLEKDLTALINTRDELEQKLNNAYTKTRDVENELANSIEEGGRLQQLNSELNSTSTELRRKLDTATERLQRLPDAFRIFQLGMTELESIHGGAFDPVQQQSSPLRSSQIAPVLPSVEMRDGQEGAADRSSHPRLREKAQRKSGSEIATTSSSAGGMFSKKRNAEEAELKTQESDPKKNRLHEEEDDDNAPKSPNVR